MLHGRFRAGTVLGHRFNDIADVISYCGSVLHSKVGRTFQYIE